MYAQPHPPNHPTTLPSQLARWWPAIYSNATPAESYLQSVSLMACLETNIFNRSWLVTRSCEHHRLSFELYGIPFLILPRQIAQAQSSRLASSRIESIRSRPARVLLPTRAGWAIQAQKRDTHSFPAGSARDWRPPPQHTAPSCPRSQIPSPLSRSLSAALWMRSDPWTRRTSPVRRLPPAPWWGWGRTAAAVQLRAPWGIRHCLGRPARRRIHRKAGPAPSLVAPARRWGKKLFFRKRGKALKAKRWQAILQKLVIKLLGTHESVRRMVRFAVSREKTQPRAHGITVLVAESKNPSFICRNEGGVYRMHIV